jgi:two-component system, LuxR family, response regulator FixJ
VILVNDPSLRLTPLMAGKPLIAIVDDEVTVRRSLERLVRAHGYATLSFPSGDELLRSLNGADVPACILLDVHMPGLSGFDVLEALRKKTKRIPVIVVTASCEPSTRARVTELGALECLVKPVDTGLLLETIDVAIEQRTVDKAGAEHRPTPMGPRSNSGG